VTSEGGTSVSNGVRRSVPKEEHTDGVYSISYHFECPVSQSRVREQGGFFRQVLDGSEDKGIRD
jgi:hypothetical protein